MNCGSRHPLTLCYFQCHLSLTTPRSLFLFDHVLFRFILSFLASVPQDTVGHSTQLVEYLRLSWLPSLHHNRECHKSRDWTLGTPNLLHDSDGFWVKACRVARKYQCLQIDPQITHLTITNLKLLTLFHRLSTLRFKKLHFAPSSRASG